MYVWRNIEARSRKHCCRGQAVIILSVFVDLSIQHALRMRYIVICVMSGSTKFFNIMS